MGPANKKTLVYERLYPGIKNIVKGVLTVSGDEKTEDLVLLANNTCKEKKEESPWVERFFDDIEQDKGKVVYGKKEVLEALQGALLEVLIINQKPSDKLKQIADDVGCTIIISDNYKIFEYGDAVGLKWFLSFKITENFLMLININKTMFTQKVTHDTDLVVFALFNHVFVKINF